MKLLPPMLIWWFDPHQSSLRKSCKWKETLPSCLINCNQTMCSLVNCLCKWYNESNNVQNWHCQRYKATLPFLVCPDKEAWDNHQIKFGCPLAGLQFQFAWQLPTDDHFSPLTFTIPLGVSFFLTDHLLSQIFDLNVFGLNRETLGQEGRYGFYLPRIAAARCIATTACFTDSTLGEVLRYNRHIYLPSVDLTSVCMLQNCTPVAMTS